MSVVDYTGKEYNIGDYVFCAINSYDSVSTFIGKVCKVGEVGVTVFRHLSWRKGDGCFVKTVLQKPSRDVIIPEEIAERGCPELLGLNVMPKEYEHLDTLGVKYKVGDYVFVAQHSGNSSVRTYFAKVVKINPESIGIYRNSNCTWRKNTMETSILMVPGRHMIVPEEVALRDEPKLKD